ncbi:MAG: hypothetical protein NDJ89_09800 [Oligoflexia bacterium]|nr:hypothetical protein [Oligoflexia bacterium]
MNNFIIPVTAAFSFVFLFASCAHHRDVRAGADGIHRVIVRGQDKEGAERSAISQAEHFCEQRKLAPAFMDEKTQYTGTMDEKTRDTVRKASSAAMVLGGVGGVAGSGATRTGGTVLGTAGTVGSIMTGGEDYTAEMRFKCQ